MSKVSSDSSFILILIGLPYSGKSTLAGHLGSALDIPVISWDEIMHSSFTDPSQVSYDLAQEKFMESLKSNLRHSKQSFVLDSMSLTENDRHQLGQLCKQHGFQVRYVYLNTPLVVCLSRWALSNRQKIPLKNVLDAYRKFQMPKVQPLITINSYFRYQSQLQKLSSWIDTTT